MQSTARVAGRDAHGHMDSRHWKRLAQLAALPAQAGLQLLEQVRGAFRRRTTILLLFICNVVAFATIADTYDCHCLNKSDCSSVDNPGERPENTLTRSSCERELEYLSRSVLAQQPLIFHEWARRIQHKCGCARGAPCYWSTYVSTQVLFAGALRTSIR